MSSLFCPTEKDLLKIIVFKKKPEMFARSQFIFFISVYSCVTKKKKKKKIKEKLWLNLIKKGYS